MVLLPSIGNEQFLSPAFKAFSLKKHIYYDTQYARLLTHNKDEEDNPA